VDLVVSFIPEASMGSAIEMWQAYCAGIPIVTISDLTNNWVVKLLSTKIYTSLDEFVDDTRYLETLITKNIKMRKVADE
jgi:hypothetical protein